MQFVVALTEDENPTDVVYILEQPSIEEAMERLGWKDANSNAGYYPWLEVSSFLFFHLLVLIYISLSVVWPRTWWVV